MKKGRIVMIVFILLIAIGLTGILAMSITGGFGGGGVFARLVNTQTLQANDLENLTVRYRSDSITILPSPTDEIILEEYMSKVELSRFATVSQNGADAYIQQGEWPVVIFFGFNISYAKLYVPYGWQGKLDVETKSGSLKAETDLILKALTLETSSGSVRMQNVECAGNLRAASSSGSVHGGNLTAGGDVEMETSSGSVKAENVQAASLWAKSNSGSIAFGRVKAATVRAEASSGSVHFGAITGSFDLDSKSGTIRVEGGEGSGRVKASSGGVRVRLDGVTGNVDLASTSGSVRLEVPRDTGMDFYATTSSGSINTPFDDDLQYSSNKKEASGAVGSGQRHSVRCQASSGSVHVEWR